MQARGGIDDGQNVLVELEYLRGEVARLRNLLGAVAACATAGAGSAVEDAEHLAIALERDGRVELTLAG